MKPRKFLVFKRYSYYNYAKTYDTLEEAKKNKVGHIYKLVE